MEPSLLQRLQALAASDQCPMHMPGHKRHPLFAGLPYTIDITEIDGFDNLHEPASILADTATLAAKLYGADAAFPLINGSTCGILAGIRAAIPDGGTVILSRGCHKSVYHALELFRLRPVYLPGCDVTLPALTEAFANAPDARLVIVTSPAYTGEVSDIQAISKLVHHHGAALLVDGAHGAHLGFSPFFPAQPAKCGADLTIVSLHKTLPAMTQTALALLQGDRIPRDALAQNLAIFETSSPSYPLLASIDSCLRLLESDGNALFDAYAARLSAFYAAMQELRCLYLGGRCGDPFFDPGKLVIRTDRAGISGAELAARLRTEYHIEPEMAAPGYVLLMTSICDDGATFSRVKDALLALDALLHPAAEPASLPAAPTPEAVVPMWQVRELEKISIPLDTADGRVSASYVWAYPPGIPLLTPGERITPALLTLFDAYQKAGITLHDTHRLLPKEMAVLADCG